MLYLIGGAPRSGKSILGQRIAAKLNISWISTDLLIELLRVKDEVGVKGSWDATSEHIRDNADWFFPYLERFAWGVYSQAGSYVIEGVDFLPAHVAQLSNHYQIRSVFLGCSKMTLERLDQFPGKSHGYVNLPEDFRIQVVQDIPLWSDFIRQETKRFGFRYIDIAEGFSSQLAESENHLLKPTDAG
jgi:2-phosphoglycerate kinase